MKGSAKLLQLLVSIGGEFEVLVRDSHVSGRISIRGHKIMVNPSNHEQLLKDLETYKQIQTSPLYKALL